jgi:hypothetical protein
VNTLLVEQMAHRGKIKTRAGCVITHRCIGGVRRAGSSFLYHRRFVSPRRIGVFGGPGPMDRGLMQQGKVECSTRGAKQMVVEQNVERSNLQFIEISSRVEQITGNAQRVEHCESVICSASGA